MSKKMTKGKNKAANEKSKSNSKTNKTNNNNLEENVNKNPETQKEQIESGESDEENQTLSNEENGSENESESENANRKDRDNQFIKTRSKAMGRKEKSKKKSTKGKGKKVETRNCDKEPTKEEDENKKPEMKRSLDQEKQYASPYQHYDIDLFPCQGNWMRIEDKNEYGEYWDEEIKVYGLEPKRRSREDLMRTKMFRVEKRRLGISPEDFDFVNGTRQFPVNREWEQHIERVENSYQIERIMGRSWRELYDPERKTEGWSEELKGIMLLTQRFEGSIMYQGKPLFMHRVIITARELLRKGADDGQFQPHLGLYEEFKKAFFWDGDNERSDYENRWFFFLVRVAILFFRERAWKTDYDPWRDTFLDLGAPNEGKGEAYMVEDDSSVEELNQEDVNQPKSEQRTKQQEEVRAKEKMSERTGDKTGDKSGDKSRERGDERTGDRSGDKSRERKHEWIGDRARAGE